MLPGSGRIFKMLSGTSLILSHYSIKNDAIHNELCEI